MPRLFVLLAALGALVIASPAQAAPLTLGAAVVAAPAVAESAQDAFLVAMSRASLVAAGAVLLGALLSSGVGFARSSAPGGRLRLRSGWRS